MNDRVRRIEETIVSINALTKIIKDADPASGVSISFRRGVARDSEEVENDELERPWVTIETAELEMATQAIELMLEAQRKSLRYQITNLNREHEAVGLFLEKLAHTAMP